jgi:hypothetical protein
VNRPPLDYAERYRFLPSSQPLTFGEKLVLLFRLNGEAISFYFAMASIALLVGVVVVAFVRVS